VATDSQGKGESYLKKLRRYIKEGGYAKQYPKLLSLRHSIGTRGRPLAVKGDEYWGGSKLKEGDRWRGERHKKRIARRTIDQEASFAQLKGHLHHVGAAEGGRSGPKG